MSELTIVCLIISAIFFGAAIVFALLGEKGTMLISKFNTIPKAKRDLYDKAKMCIDMRNSLFLWFVILLIGGILSHFLSHYFAIISIVVWLGLLSRRIHIDPNKAFVKYLK